MEAQARYPGRHCIPWFVINGYSACAGQWRLSYKARKKISPYLSYLSILARVLGRN